MEPLLPDYIYHIYNRAIGSENIFREEENYRFFLNKFKQHLYPLTSVYTYNLLQNHFHFLLKIRDRAELDKAFSKFKTLEKLDQQEQFISKQFSNFFSSYAQSYNKMYRRTGSLFIKNFKREIVVTRNQFQNTFGYIQLNAVKHGFVKHEEDWNWSSCAAYRRPGIKTLIDVEGAISFFGSFEKLHHFIKQKRVALLSMNFE